ncbi:UDPglucose 6-dehydrogenase [Bacillus ectoiniformans]|uniref:UDP-glucose dehydrogenase family protein n=1 Tax=Bacillus ectoiniformans TaxID=1494429 RepID=UPI0023BA4FBA|nr:UDP-glucose/GDP-mannose dehydrogenase family protein [Bacillus ectoiniformans]MBM7648399.1 UDPglucose 6-dehydrogenase [Bacillus ectoiniformans]
MKMKLAIAGTGYVGLVTGVCLAEVGHTVICYDIQEEKISLLSEGKSPIYEPGVEDIIKKNMEESRLFFTTDPGEAYKEADCIFIAVGTPESEDGSANMQFVEEAAMTIASHIKPDSTVVIKSTVPVGVNERIEDLIFEHSGHRISVVSNPEFLREGSAIHDSFNGDRIVIGANDQLAGDLVEKIYQPFNIPVVRTDVRSAEMIKYASNAFLATKISFINEVANLCEATGANVADVAKGMGMDKRIGEQFLRAGIGFGGSCFPKDTKALQKLAGDYHYDFKILSAVIDVNSRQKLKLFEKAREFYPEMTGKKAAILGLSFKPNTDDIREAPSIELLNELLLAGAEVEVYDPIAMKNVETIYGNKINYASSAEACLQDKDVAFIVTEWEEIKSIPLESYRTKMTVPNIVDGRNCYSLEEAAASGINYLSIGRQMIKSSQHC